jgi:hypothetical protein
MAVIFSFPLQTRIALHLYLHVQDSQSRNYYITSTYTLMVRLPRNVHHWHMKRFRDKSKLLWKCVKFQLYWNNSNISDLSLEEIGIRLISRTSDIVQFRISSFLSKTVKIKRMNNNSVMSFCMDVTTVHYDQAHCNKYLIETTKLQAIVLRR